MPYFLEQLFGIFGAICILAGYFVIVVYSTRKVLAYTLSLVGGVALFVLAVYYRNIGLVFLEISWIAINSWGLCLHARKQEL